MQKFWLRHNWLYSQLNEKNVTLIRWTDWHSFNGLVCRTTSVSLHKKV